jgi:polar amino acid transport system substrate-binding protein
MKKIVSVLLATLMMVTLLAGCSSQKEDWAYIEDKGTLVIGITLYEPMNYYDEEGNLTGFDTEFAEAVCEKLGVEPVFQVIEWDQKEFELQSKSIDCIWNGLTVTEERKEDMAFSTSYVENMQVVVINKDNADTYKAIEDFTDITICAESGSAGQSAIEDDATLSTNEFIGVSAQKDGLLEVKSGTCDACVLDWVLARAVITEDTDYSDLMVVEGIELAKEEYAIGLRLEDAQTLEKINNAIAELMADGTMQELGEKYGVNVVY